MERYWIEPIRGGYAIFDRTKGSTGDGGFVDAERAIASRMEADTAQRVVDLLNADEANKAERERYLTAEEWVAQQEKGPADDFAR
jgi:hypothetical protein